MIEFKLVYPLAILLNAVISNQPVKFITSIVYLLSTAIRKAYIIKKGVSSNAVNILTDSCCCVFSQVL